MGITGVGAPSAASISFQLDAGTTCVLPVKQIKIMITEIHESNMSFHVTLKAETLAEAAFITRFGLNHTKQIDVSAWTSNGGAFHLTFGSKIHPSGTGQLTGRKKL